MQSSMITEEVAKQETKSGEKKTLPPSTPKEKKKGNFWQLE
jgi:hypothetical protein